MVRGCLPCRELACELCCMVVGVCLLGCLGWYVVRIACAGLLGFAVCELFWVFLGQVVFLVVYFRGARIFWFFCLFTVV